MTRLAWDLTRPYDIGVDKGVLYLADGSGVAWNGLTAVDDGADTSSTQELYLDGVRRAIHQNRGDTDLTVAAITYPTIFDSYVGGGGNFGFSYRTQNESAYEIHLIYNVTASFAPRAFQTQGGQANLHEFSWTFYGKSAGQVGGSAPTAHLIIDTAITYASVLAAVEDILYGSASSAARLPTFTELLNLFLASPQMIVVDNGDGTWTATGPDSAIQMLDADNFQIVWPTAQYIDQDTYTLFTS